MNEKYEYRTYKACLRFGDGELYQYEYLVYDIDLSDTYTKEEWDTMTEREQESYLRNYTKELSKSIVMWWFE